MNVRWCLLLMSSAALFAAEPEESKERDVREILLPRPGKNPIREFFELDSPDPISGISFRTTMQGQFQHGLAAIIARVAVRTESGMQVHYYELDTLHNHLFGALLPSTGQVKQLRKERFYEHLDPATNGAIPVGSITYFITYSLQQPIFIYLGSDEDWLTNKDQATVLALFFLANYQADDAARAHAQYFLAQEFLQGALIEKNIDLALRYFLLVANQQVDQIGSSEARATLGGMYYFGRHVPQDYARARQYFQAIIDQADQAAPAARAKAQLFLGLMHLKGQGVAKNVVRALQLFHSVIDEDSADDNTFSSVHFYAAQALYLLHKGRLSREILDVINDHLLHASLIPNPMIVQDKRELLEQIAFELEEVERYKQEEGQRFANERAGGRQ